MNAYEAHVKACQAAGDGPGWNARFLASLCESGFVLRLAPDHVSVEALYAPLPYFDDDGAWPMPSLIVPVMWSEP